MKKRQYVTTAIDYPNAPPHMGHVLEKVLADVVVRWFRLRGDEVRFQIGSDEHGIKIQQTADKEKMTPRELVDRNVPLFQDLYKRLHVSADVYLRTTDQQKHWPTVVELWNRLKKAEMLEKRTYVGLYCAGCERFITKKDLVDGLCDIHKKAPQEVKEENWFFRMSKDSDNLKKLLTSDWDGEKYRIIPSFRENETLSLIEQGLEDVSFSRPVTSLSWGIPVPHDEKQTMYVWCDALTNYISGIDYFGLGTGPFDSAKTWPERQSARTMSEAPGGRVEWWDDAEVTHVIGKDIARFHALIWPCMLHHAKVRCPDRLLIHGFLTSEGEKMSKSLGNVVAPDEAIGKYGVDALRFYLSHEIPVGNDGDFSWKRFGELYDSALRNTIGNLLNRVLVMLQKSGGQIALAADQSWTVEDDWNTYTQALNGFDVHKAVQHVVGMAKVGNQKFNDAQPWKMEPALQLGTLSQFAEFLRHLSLMLLPVMPEAAQKIARQLGVPYADDMLQNSFVIADAHKAWGGIRNWTTVGQPSILFVPVETGA